MAPKVMSVLVPAVARWLDGFFDDLVQREIFGGQDSSSGSLNGSPSALRTGKCFKHFHDGLKVCRQKVGDHHGVKVVDMRPYAYDLHHHRGLLGALGNSMIFDVDPASFSAVETC